MIIKSNFKDFYDHQAYVWGGGDPSIQYIRKPLSPLTRGKYQDMQLRRDTVIIEQPNIKPNISADHFMFKWLSVCGKYYLLYTQYERFPDYRVALPEYKYRILTQKENPDLYRAATSTPKQSWAADRQYKEGEFSQELVEISRKIGSPVFTFTRNYQHSYSVNIEPEVPNLGELGMASIIGPEQMYQDISYFLGNIMKESPDMMPVSKMSDKEKIVGHGFDLKQSFRHRV